MRALDYIQRALAMSPSRIDYQVELGAILLCIGSHESDGARIEEGRTILREAMEGEHFQSTDELDVEHARLLVAEPDRACGYSRDGWFDVRRSAVVQLTGRAVR